MTDELTTRTWSAVKDRLPGRLSSRDQVMASLTTFRADPSASTWYGYVARLGLLVCDADTRTAVLASPCPFPGVTAQALADADAALARAAEQAPT